MASNKPKPQKFEVRSQSTAGYEERNTFSRGKSIDIYAIRRTLTSTLGIDPDTEEAWTKSIIHTYREVFVSSLPILIHYNLILQMVLIY